MVDSKKVLTAEDIQKKLSEGRIPFIPKGINPNKAREIVIVTDGVKWDIAPTSNSSILEIKQVCRELLEKYK